MRLIDILSKLQRLDQPVLETADVAAIVGVTKPHASKIAARLAEAGHLLALRRGVWAFPGRLDPLELPERLTAPQPAYVSLQCITASDLGKFFKVSGKTRKEGPT